MELPEPLQTERAVTEYDEDERLLIIRYFNELDGETTRLVYNWFINAITGVDPGDVRGVIYDFSEVKRFTASNLTETRKGSLDLNARVDLSQIPIALVAKTVLQEQHIHISMKTTPNEERKAIVRDIHQARQYIRDWHRKRH